MFNGSSINSGAFNAELGDDGPLIGSGRLIDFEQSIVTEASGRLIDFEQKVGPYGSGRLIDFEQETILRISGGGRLIDFEQQVQAEYSGRLISFEQRVEAKAFATHLERTGWDLTITLNGAEVPRNEITGMVRVERTEGATTIASFTVAPRTPGLQLVEGLAGKPVTIDVTTPSGAHRIFTGIVDIPLIDLVEKKTTINCIDRRVELINAQLGTIVKSIGAYSSVIFNGTPKDTAEELQQRLTTIHASVDFDAYGVYTFTSKRPKTTADFFLTGLDVLRRDPKVEYTSRNRVINKVNISFDYRFARLHHMQRNFYWESPINSNICLYLLNGYTLAARTMVTAAINSSPWPIRGDISFINVQPSGYYCGVIYSTVQYQGETIEKKDSEGNTILDADGKPVYETRITGATDFRPMFCNGASWQGTTRWAQTVTERYSLTVQAPQSIAIYNTVESASSYSLQDETDASAWEDYKTYDNPYNQVENTYHIDTATSRSTLNSAIATALNIAKTTILDSHRDTRVTIATKIWPQIDLKHTVQLNSISLSKTAQINAKGKVIGILHELNMLTTEATTTVTLGLSRSQGSQAESGFSIPGFAPETVDPGSGTVLLGNHYGMDPTNFPEWNGRIGNAFVGGARTNFAEQFVVDTPPIPDSVREEKIKTTGAVFNVAIPNDLLEITF